MGSKYQTATTVASASKAAEEATKKAIITERKTEISKSTELKMQKALEEQMEMGKKYKPG